MWHYKGLMSWWSFWVTNISSNWYNGHPLMSKDPCRPHTGNTQWGICHGYACSHGIACHTTISIIWHTKKFNLVKWGVELKMNWLNWSIPISWGSQFQFNSNSKSFNSIPIQFMLNWIELIINSNSIHELIRALVVVTFNHVLRPWIHKSRIRPLRLWIHTSWIRPLRPR